MSFLVGSHSTPVEHSLTSFDYRLELRAGMFLRVANGQYVLVYPSRKTPLFTQPSQPFNYAYEWHNVSNVIIYDEEHTELNSYKGGVFQQATSGVSLTSTPARFALNRPRF